MAQFRCNQCGELHDEYPELGFSCPYYFLGLADEEIKSCSQLTDDVCRIDGDFFIRGCLEIPILENDDSYAYGVWISVSEKNFKRYIQHLQDNRLHINDRYVGYISNSIPGYDETLNLRAAAHVREEWRPLIELEPTDHPLAILQRNGMTIGHLSRIVADYIH